MKKIVLALPNCMWRSSMGRLQWSAFPYGLCMIAAVLERNKEYDVRIIDANKEQLTREQFAARLLAENPDVVGLAAHFDYFGITLHEAARIVRETLPATKIIAGGVYVTTHIEKAAADPNIDYAIMGEGERTVPIVLDAIFNGAPITADGIYRKGDGGAVIGQGRSQLVENLDALPFPAYHLIDFQGYANTVSRNSQLRPPALPYAEIFTTRGCPFNCAFCQAKFIGARKFRVRSAANVLAEVDWLVGEYGIRSVLITSDNTVLDRQQFIDIVRGLKERRIEWKAINIAMYLLDEELLDIIADCGCKVISVAIESSSERVLREIIHKPHKPLEYSKAMVRKAQSLGIYVIVNFIVGFPGETWEEIRGTLRFADELNADYVKLYAALPLPHTELYDLCEKGGCFAKGFSPEDNDWNSGQIETEEFSANDLTILRAYEWDRINFSTPEKRARTASMMEITEEALAGLRRRVRREMLVMLR